MKKYVHVKHMKKKLQQLDVKKPLMLAEITRVYKHSCGQHDGKVYFHMNVVYLVSQLFMQNIIYDVE